MKGEYILQSLEDTQNLAQNLAPQILDMRLPRIILLKGNLGSGKTTFSKYFAQSIGIKKYLTSPTFVIMKSYNIPNYNFKLNHIDLYRLEKEWELEELEILSQTQNSNDIFLIEWADKFLNVFNHTHNLILKFEHISDNIRKITIQV